MPFDNETYRPIPEGHRRLLVLAEFLERLKPEQLDMEVFVSQKAFHECGTAACAIGWCTVAFPKQWYLNGRLPLTTGATAYDPFTDAVAFFGIDYIESDKLFTPGYDDTDTPAGVAARIRTFVAEQAKVLA